MSKVSEHYLYPKIEEWLDNIVGCQYTAVRKFLWDRQPDVVGVKLTGYRQVKMNLYLIEVKVIESLTTVYNVIGELEISLARFKKKSSVFSSLYPYIAVLENVKFKEIREYADNRNVGVIRIADDFSLVIEREPTPLTLNKALSKDHFKDHEWIIDEDEKKIFKDFIYRVGWWKIRERL